MILSYGSHKDADGQCLMEAVALLAGEEKTDAPACACPVLAAYGRRLNDAMGRGAKGDALRAKYLADLAPLLVGSRSTPEVERARALVLADHAVRVLVPLALDAAGLAEEAAKMRAIDPIRDRDTARAAAGAARAADAAARAADWAADWAARAAAGAADARGAARGAAWAAADAAYAAADTDTDTADAAARAAGWAADAAAADAWAAARNALVAALEAAP